MARIYLVPPVAWSAARSMAEGTARWYFLRTMTDELPQRRRYGDKEVGLILKRAAELQQQEPASGAEGGGLTLPELEEIAAEAGIDPRYLRRAAAEVESGSKLDSGKASLFFGAPLTIELERTLPGEMPEEAFSTFVPDIQQAAGGHGQASALGRTFTWQSSTPSGERSLQVTVTSRDGRTRIRIEERLSNLAGQLFGGMLGGGGGGIGLGIGLGVGIGALQSAAFAIAWPASIIGGAYLLARSIYTSTARKRRRVLRDLLDRLTERIESAVPKPSLDGPQRGRLQP